VILNDELKRIMMEVAVVYFNVYSNIFLEGLRKTMKSGKTAGFHGEVQT
jgi:hypothetical protein